jgi:hypothetical protein
MGDDDEDFLRGRLLLVDGVLSPWDFVDFVNAVVELEDTPFVEHVTVIPVILEYRSFEECE